MKILPLRHVSIRIPWNDTDWTGKICEKPENNSSCLILKNISQSRTPQNDKQEVDLAGKSWDSLHEHQLPPCVAERGAFMSPNELRRHIVHPYSKSSQSHKHLLPTSFRYPPYSAACIPFDWMLKEAALEKAERLNLDWKPELEKEIHTSMGFSTNWVQTRHNQLEMLDTFFGAIQPEESLCFFYAKRTPLIDDTQRVIVGVGLVKDVGKAVEYQYNEESEFRHSNNEPFRCMLWERSIQHSIREDFKNGFLLPYHEIIAYLDEHPEEDPKQFVAFAPSEYFDSFSFASEHVTNDGAISSLLACAKVLKKIENIVPGPWLKIQQWIDQQINRLWQMRGPCPGLGSALSAFGVQHGTLLAYEVERQLAGTENLNPWPMVDKIFKSPETQPKIIKDVVSDSICQKWKSLPKQRLNILQLLSRFELTIDQATRYYVHESSQRKKLSFEFSDDEILENPFRLYEYDRKLIDAIELAIIDRGLFPDAVLREKYPLEKPSLVSDATDKRRVEAFVIRELENAAIQGHTLLPRKIIIRNIRDRDVQPPCSVDGDLMALYEKGFSENIELTDMADQQVAYKLKWLADFRTIIRATVLRRLKGRRHQFEIDWVGSLEQIFGPIPFGDEDEQKARDEKVKALEELFASRFSVLIGPAGTGKTSVLKALCDEVQVSQGGVLLLAPTGKARVRMEEQIGIKGAKTIAQFLLPLGRYIPVTGNYILSEGGKYQGAKTVIIDESSMLTEDQLAAVLDALSGIDRLILVGDPKQLPPIGAGRPFIDIVRELMPKDIESIFPRFSSGFAELIIPRRQKGVERPDLLLAEWFSGRPLDPGADEIWVQISEDKPCEQLKFVQWNNPEDLRKKLLDTLIEELNLHNIQDCAGFECSLGGSIYDDRGVFFWSGKIDREGKVSGGAASCVENWQILSAVRNEPYGVSALNRLIQQSFRAATKEWALKKYRKIPKPMGKEEILYGDKVINLRNKKRKDIWPDRDDALHYVANGEIGVVVGQFKGRNANYKKLPWKLEVEFSSQRGFKYGYGGRDFSEEGDNNLELAYALTIHKVQGSEFGKTFLVIPEHCRILSRELLYTALTRQRDKVILFHQGEKHELKKYAVDSYSESGRRLTDIFKSPDPVESETSFLEQGLIHRTSRGEYVRSKSEVIIANLLKSKGIEYEYEAPLIDKHGVKRYPDFSFELDDLGVKVYWEHLGMLHNSQYKKRWNKKKSWYLDQGIMLYEDGNLDADQILVTTKDSNEGAIQSDEIERLIDNLLG